MTNALVTLGGERELVLLSALLHAAEVALMVLHVEMGNTSVEARIE